ncbi:DUF371 domain-containing protein [Candidatus Woesearchaeota archaeon]|nr:DUF371 domain-containing protein [Candidatus Woesearchaeota archaeon]
MNSYSFNCYGHKNVLATHAKTLEFTKDDDLTLDGDCIIGVKADFELGKIREFIEGKKRISVLVKCDEVSDEFECVVNESFNSDEEMVFRISNFISDRTLGIRCSKGAIQIDRKLIEKMKNKNSKIVVHLE